jgi:hypothetical protein
MRVELSSHPPLIKFSGFFTHPPLIKFSGFFTHPPLIKFSGSLPHPPLIKFFGFFPTHITPVTLEYGYHEFVSWVPQAPTLFQTNFLLPPCAQNPLSYLGSVVKSRSLNPVCLSRPSVSLRNGCAAGCTCRQVALSLSSARLPHSLEKLFSATVRAVLSPPSCSFGQLSD